MTEKIIIAGSGGQGVLTIGKFLANTAMLEKKKVTWLPAYGAEKRGGLSYCSLVVSDTEIFSPLFDRADTLIVFDQRAYDMYKSKAGRDSLVIENSTLVKDDGISAGKKVMIPALSMAKELDYVRAMNVIMAGAYIASRNTLSRDSAFAMIKESLGKKESDAEKNNRAFEEGLKYAEKNRA
jgi:2-oxoglutarate ferredoxin oxidoreductase subunit gamma